MRSLSLTLQAPQSDARAAMSDSLLYVDVEEKSEPAGADKSRRQEKPKFGARAKSAGLCDVVGRLQRQGHRKPNFTQASTSHFDACKEALYAGAISEH